MRNRAVGDEKKTLELLTRVDYSLLLLFADIEVCGGVVRVSGWGRLRPFIAVEVEPE